MPEMTRPAKVRRAAVEISAWWPTTIFGLQVALVLTTEFPHLMRSDSRRTDLIDIVSARSHSAPRSASAGIVTVVAWSFKGDLDRAHNNSAVPTFSAAKVVKYPVNPDEKPFEAA